MGRLDAIWRRALAAAMLALIAPGPLSAATVSVQDPKAPDHTTVQTTQQDSDHIRPLPAGVYRAGNDVSLPRVVHQVGPHYTSDAMRAQIRGIVRLECIVGVDGTVSEVRLVRSLDALYGLDRESIAAAKQWRFEPGMKDGTAVPVMVTIDMTFAMSASVAPAHPAQDKLRRLLPFR